MEFARTEDDDQAVEIDQVEWLKKLRAAFDTPLMTSPVGMSHGPKPAHTRKTTTVDAAYWKQWQDPAQQSVEKELAKHQGQERKHLEKCCWRLVDVFLTLAS